MNMQALWELEVAEDRLGNAVRHDVLPRTEGRTDLQWGRDPLIAEKKPSSRRLVPKSSKASMGPALVLYSRLSLFSQNNLLRRLREMTTNNLRMANIHVIDNKVLK
jgi:hypothetical protein